MAQFDLRRWAEKLGEMVRQGVQVERMWQQKLEEQQKQKALAKAS